MFRVPSSAPRAQKCRNVTFTTAPSIRLRIEGPVAASNLAHSSLFCSLSVKPRRLLGAQPRKGQRSAHVKRSYEFELSGSAGAASLNPHILENGEWVARKLTKKAGKLEDWLRSLPQDVRRLFAGAIAGAASKTATAPLECVRMQLMAGKGAALEIVARTWQHGGVLGFFSGNLADVIRVMPSKAIELSTYDIYKRCLAPLCGDDGRAGPLATGLAGAAAGVTSTIAMFPLETVRTRLAVSHGQYRSIADALRQIVSKEGAAALYKGLDASLIGVVPYAALRLGMYDGLKWGYKRATGEKTLPAGQSMFFGALAGLLASTATFPLEVVRRRMMMGQQHGNTFVAVVAIAQQEGWRNLYRGIVLSWLKAVPQNAVTFLAYDSCKQYLDL